MRAIYNERGNHTFGSSSLMTQASCTAKSTSPQHTGSIRKPESTTSPGQATSSAPTSRWMQVDGQNIFRKKFQLSIRRLFPSGYIKRKSSSRNECLSEVALVPTIYVHRGLATLCAYCADFVWSDREEPRPNPAKRNTGTVNFNADLP